MSVGIAAIQEGTSIHIAAGNGYAIGRYIEELEAMGYSYDRIQHELERGGLSVAPSPQKESEPEQSSVLDEQATCAQIEKALADLNFAKALSALQAFKQNPELTRNGRFHQLQSLRMRIEHRYGPDSNVYATLMNVLRA